MATPPSFLSSFVGRSEELELITSFLRDEAVRLLTLVGPGGSGKTRLAARAADKLALTFEDGLCWVDLSALQRADQVPRAVVTALDFAAAPLADSPEELLADFLDDRHLLLVLDNCEHLLDACAHLAEQLLLRSAGLRILATSRQRLNVPGETNLIIPGLPLPDPADPTRSGEAGTALQRSDAARLFLQRARQVDPFFEITAASAEAVEAICRQVDGMPLAIELAAAAVRSFSAPDIAAHLQQHLDLLSQGSRTAPARQRSLRATLAWSYGLLDKEEQVLFRRLSVFRGSFYATAVEAVASAGQGAVSREKGSVGLAPEIVYPLLANLVEKSMLVRERRSNSPATYRMLEMVRLYGYEKLVAAGEVEAVRDAHLLHYHGLVLRAKSGLKGAEQPKWVERLREEYDNVRAALDWATVRRMSSDSVTIAQEMASGLFWFWNAASEYGEGRERLEAVLALPPAPTATRARAEALWGAGTMAWLVGDFSGARTHLEASLAQAQRLEDASAVAGALMQLARVELYQSRPEEALHLARESSAIFREHDKHHELGLVLGVISAARAMLGEHEPARAAAEEMLKIFSALGDPFFIALAHADVAWAAYHQHDLTAAVNHFEEALLRERRIKSTWLLAQALTRLGEIRRLQGAHEKATELLEESLALSQEVDARAWYAQATRHLGWIALQQNRPEEAAARLLDSLSTSSELVRQRGVFLALEGLAAVAIAEGRLDVGARLFGATEKLRESAGPPTTPAGRQDLEYVRTSLAGHLHDPVVIHARQTGRTLTLEEASQLATEVKALFRPSAVSVETTPLPNKLRIFALGPTQVMRPDRRVTTADWSYAKPRQLFFYLLARSPVTKEEAGLDFWPDASPTQLRRNFRSALYHLRQALGDRDWVLYEDGRYSFNRSREYWYDVTAFRQALAGAEKLAVDAPERALKALSKAKDLYRGDFVEDLDQDEWALVEREELRREYLHSLKLVADLHLTRQEYQRAIAGFRKLLAHDNLQESAHRGIMRAYARSGRRSDALRHYQELVRLYHEELSAAPDMATRALATRLEAGEEI